MTKSRSLTPLVLSSILGAAALTAGHAAESGWPAWRGPLATGVSPDANPPVKWSETSNVKWKIRVPGKGTSTPIVVGDKVFLTAAISTGKKPDGTPAVAAAPPAPAPAPAPAAPAAVPAETGAASGAGTAERPGERPGGERGERRGGRGERGGPGGRGGRGFGGGGPPADVHQFVVICFDRASGRTLWQKSAREEVPHEGHHRDHGFASHSPASDGKHLYVYFGSRGVHCFDLDGNVKWSKDLGRMQTRNGFGEGSSPLIAGNTIVINWDHEGADFIVALDKESGRELWRQPRDESTSWATPIAVVDGGKTQVVTSATNKVRAYDLASGQMVWECSGMTANVIPTPVTGHGLVYAISGFRGNALRAIRAAGRTGDLTDTDAIAWRHDTKTPYVPSPLLYDDTLYFYSNNNGILSALDARDGKPLIDAERIEGLPNVYASPVGAAGRVYLTGRNGEAVVIKHAPKLEILATNKLDEKFDASPALAGRDLFLRGHEFLYCLAEP